MCARSPSLHALHTSPDFPIDIPFLLPRSGINQRESFMKTSTIRHQRSLVQLAILGVFFLAGQPALASLLTSYSDSYTLKTTNQSMWSSGNQASWNFNSGLLGGAWGTYAGNSPVSKGVNAITGSANAVIIPGVCFGLLGCTSDVTGDTRTGASVNVTSSGQAGVVVTAHANGGAIGAVLPMTTVLQFDDRGAGKFHIGGTNAIGPGANITSSAPSFKAGIDGVINMENHIAATGCVIGAGCSSTSRDANLLAGQFNILAIDTTKTKPISAFGADLSIFEFNKDISIRAGGVSCPSGDCQSVPVSTPQVAVARLDRLLDHSNASLSGNTLSMSNNQTVVSLTADITGILQYAMGVPFDALNPAIDLGVASVTGSVVDVRAGINLGITQSFDFVPRLLATLTFDKPVGRWISIPSLSDRLYWDYLGYTVTVDFNSVGQDFQFVGGEMGNLLDRKYWIEDGDNFTNKTQLSIDPTVPIKAGCFQGSLSGLGSFDTCGYDHEFKTTDLFDVSGFNRGFNLGGFNVADFATLNEIIDPNAVPEPGSIALFSVGLFFLAALRRLRQRHNPTLTSAPQYRLALTHCQRYMKSSGWAPFSVALKPNVPLDFRTC